jgi:hypothetical protein
MRNMKDPNTMTTVSQFADCNTRVHFQKRIVFRILTILLKKQVMVSIKKIP